MSLLHRFKTEYLAPMRPNKVSALENGPYTWEAHLIDSEGNIRLHRVHNFRSHTFVPQSGYRIPSQREFDQWFLENEPESMNADVVAGKLFPFENLQRFYDGIERASNQTDIVQCFATLASV